MKLIETDLENGAEIYQLTDAPWPTDDIYGEQPYSSPQGDRIAVSPYPEREKHGGISILDIEKGSLHAVLAETPGMPAFHAWGEYLYFQQRVRDALLLKRVHYRTMEQEELITLPTEEGSFSYGTVSPDHRFYAVSVRQTEKVSRVFLFDLSSGARRILAEAPGRIFKHEQFSRDGRNRILIQAQANIVKPAVVNLGVMEIDRPGVSWLPVDVPPLTPRGNWPEGKVFTPRCTGHEAWIGRSDRVLLSTGYDEAQGANLWTAAAGDSAPAVVCRTKNRFLHVSVSCCGRFWVADDSGENDTPIYVGSFPSGRFRRIVYSRTRYDGRQWSHTHPYLTADNRWLIYNSSRSGLPQVHGARIRDDFLTSLAEV